MVECHQPMVDSWRLKPRKLGFIHSYQVCKLDLEPVEWYVRSRNWKRSRCLVREMVKLSRKACWVWGFGALCRHTRWHTNHTYQPPHMVSDLDSGTFLQGFILFPAFRLFNFQVCIDPFQTHLAWSVWWWACLCCAVFPTNFFVTKKHATFTKRLGKWFKPSFPQIWQYWKTDPKMVNCSQFFFQFFDCWFWVMDPFTDSVSTRTPARNPTRDLIPKPAKVPIHQCCGPTCVPFTAGNARSKATQGGSGLPCFLLVGAKPKHIQVFWSDTIWGKY